MTQTEIMAMIEEEGIEFIRLQFTDIFGGLKNKAVTPGQMEKVFAGKYSFNGSAVFDGKYCYEERLFLHPDVNAFTVLPWRPQQGKVAKIVCDVYKEDGTPFELSSRIILKNVLKQAALKGYSFSADPECEFFLFHTDEFGLPTTVSHEHAGYMDVGPADFGENARREIVLMLEEMGFAVESSHHEQAAAQHEIDFEGAEVLQTADDIQTFRFAVRSIAKRFGLYATFMPKPKQNAAGNAMHTSMKVYKDGKPVFDGPDGKPSQEAFYFIGGILKHAKGLCAIANPLVNSYKRLVDGYDAPTQINWSTKGERALVKLKTYFDHIKVELRQPDGSANPYLLMACCVAAGMDGLENKIDPGQDLAEMVSENAEHLPGSLKEAVDALMEDEVLQSALGKNFSQIYANTKYAEWEEYMKYVSDWEINRYLSRV